MKKKIFIFIIFASSLIVLSSVFKNNNSYANKSDLPSWQVTFYQETGNGTVSGGEVHITKNGGADLFGSPKTTNSSGIAWFDNGRSAFPDGTYEVRVLRTGFGDGVTTVIISGGAPTSPITTVRSGPA